MMCEGGNAQTIKILPGRCSQLLRFGIVGCINTAVDFLMFLLFFQVFGWNKLLCQVIGYSTGTANSFTWNRYWTFGRNTGEHPVKGQLARFAAVNMASLLTSVLCLKAASDWLMIHVYVSKLLAMAVSQIINYLGYKRWVFR